MISDQIMMMVLASVSLLNLGFEMSMSTMVLSSELAKSDSTADLLTLVFLIL